MASPNADTGRGSVRTEGAVLLLLAGLALVVCHGWFLRLGSDLTWDEAMNERVYARNPVAALVLYHEPNNHVLDSLIKSIFYWGFGLDDPAWRRLPAFLYAGLILALVGRGFRRRWNEGRLLAATVFAAGLLASRSLNFHALDLRGYFLGMLIILAFVEFEDSEEEFRRRRRRRVVMAMLLVWCVPTNIAFAMALLLWAALASGGSLGTRLLGFLDQAWRSVAGALLLYAPIILGILLEVSILHGKAEPGTDQLDVALGHLAGVSRPLGVGNLAWTALVALLTLSGLAFVRRAPARRGVLLILIAFGAAVALQLKLNPPPRVQGIAGIPIYLGLALVVEGLSAGWSRKAQARGALVVAGLAFGIVVPAVVESTRIEVGPRPVADLMAALAAQPELVPGEVLVLHEANSRLRLELERRYGALRVAGSEQDLSWRLSSAPATEAQDLTSRLRRTFGSPVPRGLDLERIDHLVLVRDLVYGGNYWFDQPRGLEDLLPLFPTSRRLALREFEVEIRSR